MNEKMTKRGYIERGTEWSLKAMSPYWVERAVRITRDDFDKAYPARDDEVAQVGRDYELARCERQVVNAALGERACRLILPRLSQHLEKEDSLVVNTNRDPIREGYPDPITTFTTALEYWLYNPTIEDLDIRKDSDPLREVGFSVWKRFAEATTKWQDYRWAHGLPVPLHARYDPGERTDLARHHADDIKRNIEEIFLPVMLALRLGCEREGTRDKTAFLRQHLSNIVHQTSLVRAITAPYLLMLEEHGVVEKYSRWAKNPTADNAASFLDLASQPFIYTDGLIHRSIQNGPLKVPGHCSVDVRFIIPNKLGIAPDHLLRQLHVEPPDEPLNASWVFWATALGVADETLYKNWPTRQ